MTSGGDAFHTTLIQVDEGDVLIGLMTFTGQSGTGFNYRSEFQGIGGTTLNIVNIAELLWCNETWRLTAFRRVGLSSDRLHQVLADKHSDRRDESDNDVDASE